MYFPWHLSPECQGGNPVFKETFPWGIRLWLLDFKQVFSLKLTYTKTNKQYPLERYKIIPQTFGETQFNAWGSLILTLLIFILSLNSSWGNKKNLNVHNHCCSNGTVLRHGLEKTEARLQGSVKHMSLVAAWQKYWHMGSLSHLLVGTLRLQS